MPAAAPFQILDIPLNRDVFLRNLIRHLAGTLEDVVGLREASGYISVVGQAIGDEMDKDYRAALGVERLSSEQVAAVLVDLKRRILGDFYIIEESADRIVLGNRACPFEEKVHGRPSMCMMTSNVFGVIASQNLGYAKVELAATIAQGSPECRVIVYLNQTAESDSRPGREYFRT